ncbi:MAG TPA: biotin/lipoyl-containing protein [Gemmatimonadaceae bacterium]
MKYFVTVGGKEHEVNIDGDTITLDGVALRAHIEDLHGTPITIVTIGNEVHRVVARRGEEKGQYTLSVGGHRVQAEALDDRSRTIRRLTGASAKASGPAHLHAPMPGLIVRINVAAGDAVAAGQGLVVMEAMKMENELRASAAGRVKRVAVSAGSAVEKGALLLEMEAE